MEELKIFPEFKLYCLTKDCEEEIIYRCVCMNSYSCLMDCSNSCSKHLYVNTIFHNENTKYFAAQWSKIPEGFVAAINKALRK